MSARRMQSPWMSAAEGCKYLHMRESEFDRLVNVGEIPSYRRGRTRFVHSDDLDTYMRSLPSGAKVPEMLRAES